MPATVTWRALEHAHTEKGSDWFWALGIIAISSAVVSLLFQNFLFAILILIGSFTMALLAKKPPRELEFTLTEKGIQIDQSLYPYKMMEAFWLRTEGEEPTLIVDVRKFLTPHLIIPVPPEQAVVIRTYLLEHLKEEELEEPFGQRLFEMLGF